jgi:hypothetical protein
VKATYDGVVLFPWSFYGIISHLIEYLNSLVRWMERREKIGQCGPELQIQQFGE